MKTFKTDSLQELSESLTWYKNETNFLKEECKSKDMIIAKLSKTIENLTNKKPKIICSNELKFILFILYFMLTFTIKSIKHSDLYNSLYANSYTQMVFNKQICMLIYVN